jgi:hypothetical protein
MAIVLATIFRVVPAADPSSSENEPNNSRPKITISRETTCITEPLRPDGYPDYVAALNQRVNQGVTPENNAAVPLLKALGPKGVKKEHRDKFFQQLGMAALPEDGSYLVGQNEMLEQLEHHKIRGAAALDSESLAGQFKTVRERPWKSNEFPIIAHWLEMNEEPLRLVQEASDRKKCFVPLMTLKEKRLLNGLYREELNRAREAADCLLIRALLKVGQGKINDAWQDVLCCHRLARLVNQGPFIDEADLGWNIESMTADIDGTIAHFGKLTAPQALQMRAELEALPPLLNYFEQFNLGERYFMLDCDLQRASDPNDALISQIIFGDGEITDGTQKIQKTVNALIDWDVVLRTGNEWVDKFVTAGRLANRSQRWAAVQSVGKKFHELSVSTAGKGTLLRDIFGKSSPQDIVTPRVALSMVYQHLPVAYMLMLSQDVKLLKSKMGQIAFSLAAYRAEHGAYPDSLVALTPKYIDEVPDDYFADKPQKIRYRREGDAYVMWTVSFNNKDDGGRQDSLNNFDDIVIRPVPEKETIPKASEAP